MATEAELESTNAMMSTNTSKQTSGDILEALKKILPCHVSPFGHYLGVPHEQIEIIKSRNGTPQLQAFQIYQFWKDNDVNYEGHPLTFISDALEHCGHGRAASNLLRSQRSRHRTTEGGELDESTVYKKLIEINDLNDIKIERFGLKLGSNLTDIRNTMARFNNSDFKAVIALSVYADWKSKCKENNELMKDSLSNALDAIGYQKPLPMNIEGMSSAEHIQERIEQKPTGSTLIQKLKSKRVLGLLIAAFCISLIIMVMVVLFLFLVQRQARIVVLPGDIVSLPLPLPTPPSIDVSFWGQEDTCYAEIFVINCNDVQVVSETTNILSGIDYNYFALGSKVTISGKVIRPYQIWLFSNQADANLAVEEQFHGYNCFSAADHGALCAQLNVGEKTATVSITESSYYFICCEQDPFNCSQVKNWNINKMVYSFANSSAYVTKVHTQQNVPLKISMRSYFSSASKHCPFLTLNTTACGLYKYLIDIDYSSIYSEVQGILAITIVVTVVTLIMITIFLYCWRSNTVRSIKIKAKEKCIFCNTNDDGARQHIVK